MPAEGAEFLVEDLFVGNAAFTSRVWRGGWGKRSLEFFREKLEGSELRNIAVISDVVDVCRSVLFDEELNGGSGVVAVNGVEPA